MLPDATTCGEGWSIKDTTAACDMIDPALNPVLRVLLLRACRDFLLPPRPVTQLQVCQLPLLLVSMQEGMLLHMSKWMSAAASICCCWLLCWCCRGCSHDNHCLSHFKLK